jgi:pyruvate formate lyase activating enzyme
MSESSPIFAYLEKPSMVDYPRRFAAVFFISGCTFTCGFCHNATLIGRKQVGLSWDILDSACTGFKKDWVNGVVITGGEPTTAEGLAELISFFKERFGFAVKLDTNGSDPDRLAQCLPLVDYVAMDIKCDLSFYPEFVGFSAIEKIRKSIDLIRSSAKDYEFRTTIIESVHTDDRMRQISDVISGSRRYVMQAFIPREELPGEQYRNTPRTSAARLQELKGLMNGCAAEILLRGA